MVKLVVTGAAGRMGSSIIRLAGNDPAVEVVGAVEIKGSTALGTGKPPVTDDINKVIPACDVAVDFTSQEGALAALAACLKNSKAAVIGTTGISDAGINEIKNASKKIPVVFSPNMSVGVNVLFKITEDTAKLLSGYDVEILELHHNQKKDAPSGTAAKLLDVIAKVLGRDPKKAGIYGRQGIAGARTKNEIGVHAVRAGDIVGEHTVYFAGPCERIELTHRAQSRDALARGALVAAKWVAGKAPGLYTMQDVLGI
ncbi:MAG: 4-hydroxy-tetrahydrodipicolinate reductase [Endomicrobiales bacterium]|nr:4-hydroxy-tetrahydrodipicolinate reductase [Endomicrobiales bacterium]